ncbi:hypothetical protein [Candidatus Deianiraea vastatrix]|uniref:5-methyltetrahydropteroyltriglutamate--homocysteine S-methyltransferase n=1 Tax=Candidatus Deianiraea vastatrix TaxID=2163644 RepID=A0A5B8XGW4_9RICK|nr:hypothetical protein [Candidatus Deianiraea vastatrix]QED23454.1 Cobalamin-independent homocysteine transmethylase [Candidatus Deianiraea vastatrix]
MIKTATLGFPCIGENMELIDAINNFLSSKISETELYKIGRKIRRDNLQLQQDIGIDIIPVNDFTWHDNVWDMSVMIGNIPNRYYWEGGEVPSDIYFAPIVGHRKDKFEVPGMECRSWFNTRLFYTVPELQDVTDFAISDNKVMQHFIEAKEMNIIPRPVILGPISYILLSKVYDADDEDCTEIDTQRTLAEIIEVYKAIFVNLRRIGTKEIQIDEPFLSTDLPSVYQDLYKTTYEKIASMIGDIKITLTTGFGYIGSNADMIFSLPVDCVHLNLSNYESQIDYIVKNKTEKEISLGLVDGSNVFINDIEKSVEIAKTVSDYCSGIHIATSSGLFESPLNIALDKKDQVYSKYLASAKDKLKELVLIKDCLNGDNDAIKEAKSRSKLLAKIKEEISFTDKKIDKYARGDRKERLDLQKNKMNLSHFPIIPLAMLPNFVAEKKKNADHNILNLANDALKKQNNLGFDIVTTGEYDRDSEYFDYFVNFLNGKVINTTDGFIKTYCNKYEKPPILFGDFSFEKNAEMFSLLSSVVENTEKPVKYRVIGPVTAFHRSYILCKNEYKNEYLATLSVAISEIANLAVSHGAKVIQIDEHNILEVMPTRITEYTPLLSGLGVYIKNIYAKFKDEIQVHLYITNSNIFTYIDDLDNLDIDVLLLESSKSGHDVVKNLSGYKYQGDIAIGLFDPNSIYTPSLKDLQNTLKTAIRTFDIEKLWITYDDNFVKNSDSFVKTMLNIKDAVFVLRSKFDN